MDISILKKIGLGDKEIKIYIGLLEYGASSVRSLSEYSGINRGTVYDILKKLQDQSLVSYYHQATRQKFVAEEPDKLLRVLKNKEQELKESQTRIEKLIPELKSFMNKEGERPIIRLYEGQAGVKYILEDVLKTMVNSSYREYYVYSAKNVIDGLNKAYPEFTRDRIRKKVQVKAISLASGGATSGLDERRWLGTNDRSATYILIYVNKYAFISRDTRDKPVGVIIENKMIYETQKTIFLQLWELLG